MYFHPPKLSHYQKAIHPSSMFLAFCSTPHHTTQHPTNHNNHRFHRLSSSYHRQSTRNVSPVIHCSSTKKQLCVLFQRSVGASAGLTPHTSLQWLAVPTSPKFSMRQTITTLTPQPLSFIHVAFPPPRTSPHPTSPHHQQLQPTFFIKFHTLTIQHHQYSSINHHSQSFTGLNPNIELEQALSNVSRR